MTIKTGFELCGLIAIPILLFCINKVKHREGAIAKTVVQLMWLELVDAVANIVAIVSWNYVLTAFCLGIHFVCMTWMCYCLVQYTCQYTKVKTRFLWVDDLWKGLLVLNSVSHILNVFWGHVAEYELVGTGMDAYWILHPLFMYDVHVLLCFIMWVEIILRMVAALLKSPRLYRWKYFSILLVLLFVVVVDTMCYFMENQIGVTTLFFVVCTLIFLYATFHFVPYILRKKMLTMVFRKMEDTLILFDDRGNCVYINNKWEQNDIVNEMTQQQFDEWIKESHDENNIICVKYGEAVRYYDDRYAELRDEKGKYIGCYYIFRDITVEHELKEKQEYLLNFDTLTGLYNRKKFFQTADEFMKKRPEESFLIVCSDIRKFKVINEIFGLQMGDKVLKYVAGAYSDYCDGKYICGRIGANRFAMCIPEKNFDVGTFTGKMKDSIKALQMKYPVINHIGIYRVEDRSLTVSAMCDRAMLAVTSIKTDYQRGVVYYDESLREQLLQEQEILKDLKQAFEQKQFIIYLQPQFNHKNHEIIGAEALVRWMHPEKGLIPPNVFIPLLESIGLVTKLNVQVWELACKQIHTWQKEGKEPVSISVNISTKDFFYVDIYEVLTDLIAKYEVPVSKLKLEITESAFSIDLEKQLSIIEKLQAEGFIIEMDDFGSGYSSLNSLKDIPVDILKMDMVFMSKSDRYNRSADILRMVVAMADKLNMPVIAEGVETREQADFLGEIGCDIIQGYYYARPMPVAQFEEMYYNQEKVYK